MEWSYMSHIICKIFCPIKNKYKLRKTVFLGDIRKFVSIPHQII